MIVFWCVPSSSRSTWACELKFFCCFCRLVRLCHAPRERVSWNLCNRQNKSLLTGHAPRERVSWNKQELDSQDNLIRHAPRERVSWNCLCYRPWQWLMLSRSTWACELKLFSGATEHCTAMSRSTWACELKSLADGAISAGLSHAPRERVSWNLHCWPILPRVRGHAPRDRVSWNCSHIVKIYVCFRHAPRERVSWNLSFIIIVHFVPVTLHVSVWVEINTIRNRGKRKPVTLHVSVWVEIWLFVTGRVVFTSRSTWACELKW